MEGTDFIKCEPSTEESSNFESGSQFPADNLVEIKTECYNPSCKEELIEEITEEHPALDEARQSEITSTSQEGKQTSEVDLQSPLRKKTRTKTSRIAKVAEAHRQNLIKITLAVLNQLDDECNNLGKTYAAKLRRMPVTQRNIADKLINDVLFKGLASHLTPSTFISD